MSRPYAACVPPSEVGVLYVLSMWYDVGAWLPYGAWPLVWYGTGDGVPTDSV
jgi:hypothetical protein